MDEEPVIEIHRDAVWVAAARIEPLGDEHARVEYLPDYRLNPLFDFAPMFRDPELIVRAAHWVDGDGRVLREWPDILANLDLDDAECQTLKRDLRAWTETVGTLAEQAAGMGVDGNIIEACRSSIDAQAESLAKLHH